jgi:hypothetical protein
MIRELKYWWNCRKSGLLDLVDDARDLHIRDLFGATPYVRKNNERILAPIFEKDQLGHENCSFQTASRTLSVYFGYNISARFLVAIAWREGYCGKNGMAQLRNWAIVARKWGAVMEEECPSDESLPWNEYVAVDFKNLEPLAKKIGSFWRVDTIDELLECIDRGYAVAIGRDWRSSYNQGGGFKAPWIITTALKKLGFLVGGHATAVVGYSFLKLSKGITIEKNSYSDRWGDNGFFFCELEALKDDMKKYGAFAITPVPYTPKDIVIKEKQTLLDKLKRQLEAMSNQNKLYQTALDLYKQGAILSQHNITLGCGYAMTAVWNKAFPDKKINWTGTSDWWAWLKKSDLWEEVLEPEAGCVIISPTPAIPPQSPLKNGHIGIVGKNKAPNGGLYVMSNNSNTGKWDAHWDTVRWDDYYHKYGKIKTSYFKLVG